MSHKKPLLTFRQTDPIRLECAIDLNRLFDSENERSRFDEKWIPFLKSEPYNHKIYRLNGNQITYQSEHFIPLKKDNRPPLLLVFGNPASHSVAAGIFFAFKDNGKESRFWKSILKPAGVLSFSFDENLPAEKLNALRKKQLLKLDYETPFRIGLSVFISLPSAPSGPWGGVAGVQKLIGFKALRRLETEESKRITKCAKAFIGDDSRGKVVTFQKNAWNGLRSNQNPDYKIEMAKDAKLVGCLRDQPKIPIFGAPPTRLAGPARNVLESVVFGKAS